METSLGTTLKLTTAGLAIGTLVLCANFQFGLQTGWVSMMSMPAALLGFAWFKTLKSALTPQDNVYIQSVAIAVGTGPLSFGLIGAIPAVQFLLTEEEGRISFSVTKLILWSLAIGYMGIFTSVLLRETIMRNKVLKFPSGSAAAALIGTLHDKPIQGVTPDDCTLRLPLTDPIDRGSRVENRDPTLYYRNIVVLVVTFIASSVYTIVSKYALTLQNIPIFGQRALKYLWKFELSPAYVGQGIVMGLPTTVSMLSGAVLGWGILAPLSRHKGWAPGEVEDWQNGAQGWIMWVSLAIMVADTGVSFLMLTLTAMSDLYSSTRQYRSRFGPTYNSINTHDAHVNELSTPDTAVSRASIENPHDQHVFGIWGLALSSLMCVIIIKCLFTTIPIGALILAVCLSPFLSLLGVRALGETDLNPVSSIAKLTQFVFGVLLRNHPQGVLLNIIAGAITEAGAEQAGDLMQDYKTGSLLGALMTSQTVGMMAGTTWSVLVSGFVYKLYTSHFEIPGQEYRIPTSYIWTDCARLMTGSGLPPKAGSFSIVFGLIFVVFAVAKHIYKDKSFGKWIPSGVAVGIGMYNVPQFTLARFLGGVISYLYTKMRKDPSDNIYMVILSSGLILGEGIMSVVYLMCQI
ncbi:hypothetical protein DASB73_023950 [Starmerella bacillaris]|uniref:Oligopeptide transporter n=1 Tax=Starmerella bacillaris TaxID=1247836 RepID=A0AAV5RJQ3_STABA|nr:hypothetical protein DASB73_023950 [Starmerella bacillaris]